MSRFIWWARVSHLVSPLSLLSLFFSVRVAYLVSSVSLSFSYAVFFGGSVLLILLALSVSYPGFFVWVGVAHLVCPLSLIPGFLVGPCCSSRLPSNSYPGFFGGRCCSFHLPSISYPGFFGGSVLLISFSLYLLSRVFWRSVLLISFAFYLLSVVFCWVRVAHLVFPLSLITGKR